MAPSGFRKLSSNARRGEVASFLAKLLPKLGNIARIQGVDDESVHWVIWWYLSCTARFCGAIAVLVDKGD
jgi:hypothetical protein